MTKNIWFLIFISILLAFTKQQAIPIIADNQNCQSNQCDANLSQKIQLDDPETVKLIKQKIALRSQKTFQQSLLEREALEEQYKNILGENLSDRIKIPNRAHSDGSRYHNKNKGRRLQSTNNQYKQINEGNSLQANDMNFIYSIRAPNITVHRLDNTKLTQIYFEGFPPEKYPQQVHANGGYFAVIFQKYQPNTVQVIVYRNNNSKIEQVRSYEKQGRYVESREYNMNLLVVTQIQIDSQIFDKNWNISDIGLVNQTLYNGLSANKTANNLGPAARSIAKIPLGPASNTNYKFATYLFCDFSFDMTMSSNLNIFIAGNNYNHSQYTVSVQTLSFDSELGEPWGKSKWAVLPGLIINNYQMHEYNKYFRVVLIYINGQLGTVRHVAIAKLPMSTFKVADGKIYYSLGIQGGSFLSSRFFKDLVVIIFDGNTIKSFSTSFGSATGLLKLPFNVYYLYPYGRYLVSLGSTEVGTLPLIATFQISAYKVIFKQSISLSVSDSNGFAYSQYGWFSNQFLQFNYNTKRAIIPLFTSQNQPHKSGYYQMYVDPQNNCLSSLPVPNPCPVNSTAPVLGKSFKHWKQSVDYNWKTGRSEEIIRSATIMQNGKPILITASYCQLQARVILDPHQTPSLQPTASNQMEVQTSDLCR